MNKILLASSLLCVSLLSAEESTVAVVGLQGSYGTGTQTLASSVNSTGHSHQQNSYKLLVGSDVNLYGVGQTSRFYGAYKYSALSGNISDSMNTFSAGYMENMKYLSFFKNDKNSIYPFAAIELGYSSIDSDKSGFNSEIDLGVTYEYSDFEFSIAYAYNYTNLGEYTPTGVTGTVAVYEQTNQVMLGATYKFTSGGNK